jgi:hypothetical protein
LAVKTTKIVVVDTNQQNCHTAAGHPPKSVVDLCTTTTILVAVLVTAFLTAKKM